MRRLPLWLLLGVLVGLALGLTYAWAVRPVPLSGAAPSALRKDFQDEYLELIASAYNATGDQERARARLALFPSVGSAELTDLARQVLASRGAVSSVRGLATLSASLAMPMGAQPSALATAQPSASPTLVPPLPLTLVPSATFIPQATPSATPLALFTLLGENSDLRSLGSGPIPGGGGCHGRREPSPGDRSSHPLGWGPIPSLTGLEPEKGLGYGDFEMTPGITYQVQVGASGDWVGGLVAPSCAKTDGTSYPGSVLLTFESK